MMNVSSVENFGYAAIGSLSFYTSDQQFERTVDELKGQMLGGNQVLRINHLHPFAVKLQDAFDEDSRFGPGRVILVSSPSTEIQLAA